MKPSSDPNLYTLPRRERDPMGVIFPSIGIMIWLGAASCWAATQEVARALGYQAPLGHPLVGHIYSPFELIVWAAKFDHPARVGLEVHRVFIHAYKIVLFGNGFGVLAAVLMAARRIRRLQRHIDLYGSAHWATPDEVRSTTLPADFCYLFIQLLPPWS